MADVENVKAETLRLVATVDLGGTNLRAATVDAAGNIARRVKHPTPQRATDPRQIVEAIVSAIHECTQGQYNVEEAAILVPGTVDPGGEVVIQVPNLPCLDGFNLKSTLQAELGWHVVLENDANAAALGEMWLGAARGRHSVVCITLGTGVGGGIILDGRLWRGADGSAGEIGHTTVEPSSKLKCKCGNSGCLELFASATAITRMIKEQLPRYPDSVLQDQGVSAREVYEAGLKGDELAIDVFRIVGRYLGVAAANLVNLLNPEVIVIGGGVANAWQLFQATLHEEVARRSLAYPAKQVKIVAAECGDDAGLLGAARLALRVGEQD
jgi:glucokinase